MAEPEDFAVKLKDAIRIRRGSRQIPFKQIRVKRSTRQKARFCHLWAQTTNSLGRAREILQSADCLPAVRLIPRAAQSCQYNLSSQRLRQEDQGTSQL